MPRLPLPPVLRRSYMAKLVVSLVAVTLVVTAFGAVAQVGTAEQLRDDVRTDLTTQAAVQADELDTWLSAAKTDTVLTSKEEVLESGDTDRIQTRLSERVENGNVPDGVVAIHYLDTEAMVIEASSNDDFVGVSPAEQGAAFAENPPEFDGPNDVYVTEPFRIDKVDFPVVAVISPIEGKDHKALVYMVNIAERTEGLAQASEEGFTVVVNGEGTFVAHPDRSRIGTSHGGEVPETSADGAGFTTVQRGGQEMVMAYTALEVKDWVLMVHVPTSAAYALGSSVTSSIVGLIFIALTSIAVIGVTVGGDTVVSLRRLSERARAIADGDLETPVAADRTDEIGTVFASIDEMRRSLSETIEEATEGRAEAERAREQAEQMRADLEAEAADYAEVMRAVGDGDFTARLEPETDNEAMREIADEFNEMLSDIERIIVELTEFAEDVAETSGVVDRGAGEVRETSRSVAESVQTIADGADRQDEQLQRVSGEVSDFSASAQQIAASVDSISETSQQAADAGETGREAARSAIEEMESVEERTRQTVEEIEALDEEMTAIGEIVEVIRDIAEQTNILALNASIEAARSSADSDGFTVVAEEVKSLAEETKESAGEIEQRITDLQERTGRTVEEIQATSRQVSDGVETVDDALTQLETIVDRVEEVDASIDEINEATEDQARSLQEVSGMIDEVAEISRETSGEAEDVAAAAEQQTASLEDVFSQAEDLSDQADRLAALLEEFTVGGADSAPAGPAAGDGPTAAATDGAGGEGQPTGDGDFAFGEQGGDRR